MKLILGKLIGVGLRLNLGKAERSEIFARRLDDRNSLRLHPLLNIVIA